MTVLDKLVKAVAEVRGEHQEDLDYDGIPMGTCSCGADLGDEGDEEYHQERYIVVAMLRALPECEAAVWALIPGMPNALTYEEAQRKLVALAKLADAQVSTSEPKNRQSRI